ncbi:U-box domain-containing protein 35-like [Abrus precatorius]|uniref:RING-type E3 ubiquitin transferase n=1 Tax=Abrus precatorius TaxID=3816 RepID=A0A8B8KLY0_ABRPR|nr:U-box domain-containing protein 35-like [Abrus precatorius]
MWFPNTKATTIRKGGNGLIAVAIDKDSKGSRHALKWAADTLLSRGQTLVLIHVLHSTSVCNSTSLAASPHGERVSNICKDLFRTFHCYCSRKDIHCLDVLLEDTDVIKGITEYVSSAAIETLVLGAASRHGFIRFKSSTPSSILKGVPDFCTVYVISKGKVSSVRKATRPAPHASPLLNDIQTLNNDNSIKSGDVMSRRMTFRDSRAASKASSWQGESNQSMKRVSFSRRSCMDFAESDTDISFVSSGRPSTSSARSSSVFCDYMDSARNSRTSTSSDRSLGSRLGLKLTDPISPDDSFSMDSSRTSFSCSVHNMDEVESDMRKLKLELKQTMEMYSTACREALTAQQKLVELSNWRMEEEKKLDEARLAQEAAQAVAEQEKARSKAARETAEAAKQIARVESNRRESVELKALKEAEEMRKQLDSLTQTDKRYRRYTIEEIEKATDFFSESRKIGEGGYGPVYKCYLDHTPAAVKVLRPDSAQGKSQFQQEVNILGCIRHPNMVLLLGACPERGILIYEYMASGSLEDCLLGKKKNGPMCWQLRFRIAAEIATGLLFLHQTKPEPLVHRDLKPGNILLDHNYVSKISDVGLARLLPAVAENVTQCRMTSAAGTFCYIDPEYQQTGILGVKSDVYSLGIILLQLLTGKRPMGLAHQVGESIEKGTFAEILDASVPDWPHVEALCLANLALKCAELRRKDRPDLDKLVLPELLILREFAQENMTHSFFGGDAINAPSPTHSQDSILQDVMSEPRSEHSLSSRTPSTPSTPEEEKQGITFSVLN